MPSAKKLPCPPTPESHDPFQGRPCYEFNERLKGVLDDTFCYHCRHYLTTRCPHLDEFMDHLDDLESEYDAPPETHRQG